MIIRKATVEDAERIATISVLSWQHAYKDLIPKNFLDNISLEERHKNWIKGLKEKSYRTTLVVENQNIIAGFSGHRPARDDDLDPNKTGEIYAVYLDPDYMGKGFGKALLAEIFKELREQSYIDCIVWTLRDNFSAIEFYKRTGFQRDRQKERPFNIEGTNTKDIRFKLRL